MSKKLFIRYLGTVNYLPAWEFQRNLALSENDYLLLLTHNPVYTMGLNAQSKNLLFDPSCSKVPVVKTDRGGDVTFHGPGQLVGYLITSLSDKKVAQFIFKVEQAIINTLKNYSISAYRMNDYPGVWVKKDGQDKKIAAIGVRVKNKRTYHGFALNVFTDLKMFESIVPCGIKDKGVTSFKELRVDVSFEDLVKEIYSEFLKVFNYQDFSYQGINYKETSFNSTDSKLKLRLQKAGVEVKNGYYGRKPEFVISQLRTSATFLQTQKVLNFYKLNTVCREANCPNRFKCWAEGTATFLINGKICTRACGFCDVTTGKPEEVDENEPKRIAQAVKVMGLSHVVLTAPARDDLKDGGAQGFARTIQAIRDLNAHLSIEVLVPDFKGNEVALNTILDLKPDVFNHNIETVLRLQKAIRPQADYVRSLNVLASAKKAGLVIKSGLIVGMGETNDEVFATIEDLASIGVDILTIGQYLAPSRSYSPVMRYVTQSEFDQFSNFAYEAGISYVQSAPLVRSSYLAGGALKSFMGGSYGLVNQG
jgi:lipoic acid synthetase